MNYFFKATTVVAFLCIFNTANANVDYPVLDEPTLVFETKDEANNLVFELNSSAKKSKINIIDFNGQVLFEETIVSKTKYQKRFNLKNVPEGKYELTAENALRSIVYTINVKNGKAWLHEKNITYKPTFSVKDRKIHLHFLNNGAREVHIVLYNGFNEKVHEEVVKGKIALSKTFDLSRSLNGKYNLRVWNADGFYTETFDIK